MTWPGSHNRRPSSEHMRALSAKDMCSFNSVFLNTSFVTSYSTCVVGLSGVHLYYRKQLGKGIVKNIGIISSCQVQMIAARSYLVPTF